MRAGHYRKLANNTTEFRIYQQGDYLSMLISFLTLYDV